MSHNTSRTIDPSSSATEPLIDIDSVGGESENLEQQQYPHSHPYDEFAHDDHDHHQSVTLEDGSNHSSASTRGLRTPVTSPRSISPSPSPPPPAPPEHLVSRPNEQEAVQDPLILEIVRATQYGDFEKCRQLVEGPTGYDVNRRDYENVSLLHWAAINNRLELVKYYISRGANVDAIGGDLQSTPLHWATRQGHLSMVVLLLQNRADATLLDGDGFNCLHLAAQMGHTPIVAYLVARGADINAPDLNGMTALMWSALRKHTADPTQLLITLGASLSLTDRNRNTALHCAVLAKNTNAVTLLLKHGANANFQNIAGDTPADMALKFNTTWIHGQFQQYAKRAEATQPLFRFKLTSKSEIKIPSWRDPKLRYYIMASTPLIFFYALGKILYVDMELHTKAFAFIALLGTLYLLVQFIFDSRQLNVLAISLYISTKFWLYVTFFQYFLTVLPPLHLFLFLLASTWLFYSFYKAWRSDPGFVCNTREEQLKTIVDLSEHEGFDSTRFCSTCLVRKPLRSKHCSLCGRCVARFDHHCPWISNCVGARNHKYFIWYLASLALVLIYYIAATIQYWSLFEEEYLRGQADVTTEAHYHRQSDGDNSMIEFWAHCVRMNGWITWCFANACIHIIWIVCLLICQLYQVASLGMTTNERINCDRYHAFKRNKRTGHYRNPYNFGFVRNLVEFCECKYLSGLMYKNGGEQLRDWRYVYDEMELRYESDPDTSDSDAERGGAGGGGSDSDEGEDDLYRRDAKMPKSTSRDTVTV